MSDQEHVVLRIPRPDGGELRVLRKTYNGSAPFTSLHRYYLDEASGELRPGKQNCTIRDADLRAVIGALERIAAKIDAPAERAAPRRAQQQPSARRTGDLTTEDNSALMEAF